MGTTYIPLNLIIISETIALSYSICVCEIIAACLMLTYMLTTSKKARSDVVEMTAKALHTISFNVQIIYSKGQC